MMSMPLPVNFRPATRVCDSCSCMNVGKTLTDDCKKELADFRIELGESINKNLPLGEDQVSQWIALMDLD